MTDNRTMAEMLRAPTEGYAEAIVVPPILAKQFELKHCLINMMTSKQFFGLEKDNPHDHTRQDSLNAAAGGNLLERSTQDVLTIIKNKSKVRNSRSKLIASQVKACDTNSSSEIAKLTHSVNEQTSAMTTAMTAMLRQFQVIPPSAPVKDVKENCVTCGGAHPYYQCLVADGNTFLKLRDNIQEYVSAAAVQYNLGNPGYRPLGMANQTRPSGFAQPNLKNNQNRFVPPQGFNCGNNFNPEHSHQGPAQQNQNVHLNKLEKVRRMNEANLKTMQTQIDMGELKAITTRSGLVTDGPTVSAPPKSIIPEVDEHVEETFTDPDLAEYTIKVPPPLVPKYKPPSQREFVMHQRDPLHPNIPYPSRMLKQK
nr:hypothetical protein [Tanacetum cinerariifolium]GEZ11118.1 hypothetical protein [Tanacetum cinerariifolium]